MKAFMATLLSLLILPGFTSSTSPKYKRIFPDYAAKSSTSPYLDYAIHDQGNIRLVLSNYGTIGALLHDPGEQIHDTFPGYEFPKYSKIGYAAWIVYWIGGIVGRDTFVTTAMAPQEFWPGGGPGAGITCVSNLQTSPDYSDGAVAEQEFTVTFADTNTNFMTFYWNEMESNEDHIPLGIKITQKSRAWSMLHISDFIVFDLTVENIGEKYIEDLFIGIHAASWVEYMFDSAIISDDLCGFIAEYPSLDECNFYLPFNIAYFIDDDGNPSAEGTFDIESATSALGIKILDTPLDDPQISFNWWIYNNWPGQEHDFGPRKADAPDDRWRDMDGYIGYPMRDANKYYIFSHKEIDYNQAYTALDHTAYGWMPCPTEAADIADGRDPWMVLSAGPFDLAPGEKIPFVFAIIGGENIHQDPANFRKNFDAYSPEKYYRNLNFDDLVKNTFWAEWLYDNPGYDTDGDGYRGEYYTCCIETDIINGQTECVDEDTIYYKGDGIPDYSAVSPPIPPEVKVYPGVDEFNSGHLAVRWNGFKSEMTPDKFTGDLDFEGYRVYLSLSPLNKDFSLQASYDIEDYARYCWDTLVQRWLIVENPFTLDSLQSLYGEGFDPMEYGSHHPLYIINPDGPDSAFFFTIQDWNASDLTDTMSIHKRYSDEPFPSTLNHDSAEIFYPDELTEKGDFKYFEYEYTIRNLLPSREYYVSVTAFDFGSPAYGMDVLETRPVTNMVPAYAQNSAALVEEDDLDVIVYPNPYRIDAGYRLFEGGGFEGRGQEDMPDDRVRAIHFTNLPNKCKIRIYSIDGDLVRKIYHHYPKDHPQAMHDKWDMITRNTQAPVSGIYYWVVESESRTQIGKLVIIM